MLVDLTQLFLEALKSNKLLIINSLMCAKRLETSNYESLSCLVLNNIWNQIFAFR